MRPRDFSTVPHSSRGGLALTLAGALAFAVAAQQALAARAELKETQARVAEARREVGVLQERVKRTTDFSGADQAVIARALAAVESKPSVVLQDLVALMPKGVRLDRLELAYGREVALQAEVVARRVSDYDEFMERLAVSSRFSSIEPGPETREAELRASLHAVYRPGSSR